MAPYPLRRAGLGSNIVSKWVWKVVNDARTFFKKKDVDIVIPLLPAFDNDLPMAA
jgi:hypothetical protein